MKRGNEVIGIRRKTLCAAVSPPARPVAAGLTHPSVHWEQHVAHNGGSLVLFYPFVVSVSADIAAFGRRRCVGTSTHTSGHLQSVVSH